MFMLMCYGPSIRVCLLALLAFVCLCALVCMSVSVYSISMFFCCVVLAAVRMFVPSCYGACIRVYFL